MLKILIIEDLAFSRIILRDMLKKNGYNLILEADNAKSALQIYAEEQPELVLLDITLPDCKDLWLLEQLRCINPCSKIIICSATSQQCVINRAKELGAVEYFTKPVEEELLMQTIRKEFLPGHQTDSAV